VDEYGLKKSPIWLAALFDGWPISVTGLFSFYNGGM
jgi:hypothetical protein